MKYFSAQNTQHSTNRMGIRRKLGVIHKLKFTACFVFFLAVAGLFMLKPDVILAANVLRAHSPYLYAGDAYPIIEYILSHNSESEVMREEKNLPSFLYDTDQGYRVVEIGRAHV